MKTVQVSEVESCCDASTVVWGDFELAAEVCGGRQRC